MSETGIPIADLVRATIMDVHQDEYGCTLTIVSDHPDGREIGWIMMITREELAQLSADHPISIHGKAAVLPRGMDVSIEL